MMEKALSVVAVDDEPLSLRRLARAISAIDGVELIGTAGSGQEGVEQVRSLKPDVLILDINMAEVDGFDVLDELGDDRPLVIFATAFQEYAVRAFDVKALDYLLKPIDTVRLEQSLNNARARLAEMESAERADELSSVLDAVREQRSEPKVQQRYETEIWAPWAGRFERLPIAEIDWIKSEGDYVLVHARGKTHLIRETMANMEKRLDPQQFTRVHRSALVSHHKVVQICRRGYGRWFLSLQNGEMVPVGRSFQPMVRKWIVGREEEGAEEEA